MSTNTTSTTGYGFLHWLVAAILAIALIGLWLSGCGPGGSRCNPTAAIVAAPAAVAVAPAITPVAPAVVTPAPVATAPVAAAPGAAIEYKRVESVPAAKVYFGLDKTNLPADTDKTLAAVTSYLKANPSARAYVSGFHDPSGSVARNEDLAKNRAIGVAGNLEKLGIVKEQIIMQKPSVTTGTGEAKEARRVEVSVWANQ
jgi:K(+)-stimulated pyrophosphate-energized sodium pump